MNIDTKSLTGYLYDDALCREANDNGQNYWYAYIAEMLDELGLRARKLSQPHLANAEELAGLKVIFVGDCSLSNEAKRTLTEWVSGGGTLIGFSTKQADDLFGVRRAGLIKQPDDEYTVSAYYKFNAIGEANADSSYGFREAMLPIMSDVELVESAEESRLGTLFNAGKGNTGCDAIVKRSLGEGTTYYFAFHLPQTIWVMHQGRPVVRDIDGDGYYRVGDSIAFGRLTDLKLPYADYWLQALEHMISGVPQPFIHQLPPFADGTLPDLMLHCAGDDECTPGIQVKASHYMKNKGLAYQLNIMPSREGKFAVDLDEFNQIKANGHDISLHFDFAKPHYHFTEADIKEQLDQYLAAFDELPVATVNHCTTFTGWAEQARWASSYGIKGDNSRVHSFTPPYNPINQLGFGFGTVYPHFVYDDFKHGNARIPYAYIPIGLYEPRIYEETREADIGTIHSAIDRAIFSGWTLNVFLHPIYIADDDWNKECLPAIEEIVRYIGEKRYRAMHYSTSQLCTWWFERSGTDIEYEEWVKAEDGRTVSASFKVTTVSPSGVFVKLPIPEGNSVTAGSSEAVTYLLDGELREGTIQRQNGIDRAFCYIPCGEHRVEVFFNLSPSNMEEVRD